MGGETGDSIVPLNRSEIHMRVNFSRFYCHPSEVHKKVNISKFYRHPSEKPQ